MARSGWPVPSQRSVMISAAIDTAVSAGVASLLDHAWTNPDAEAFANLGGGLAALVVGALTGLLAWGSVVLAAAADGARMAV